jgi:hypothetical protein
MINGLKTIRVIGNVQNVGVSNMQTSNDRFPGEADQRINHLMKFYHWGRFEAQCYYYYEQFDSIDWVDYD